MYFYELCDALENMGFDSEFYDSSYGDDTHFPGPFTVFSKEGFTDIITCAAEPGASKDESNILIYPYISDSNSFQPYKINNISLYSSINSISSIIDCGFGVVVKEDDELYIVSENTDIETFILVKPKKALKKIMKWTDAMECTRYLFLNEIQTLSQNYDESQSALKDLELEYEKKHKEIKNLKAKQEKQISEFKQEIESAYVEKNDDKYERSFCVGAKNCEISITATINRITLYALSSDQSSDIVEIPDKRHYEQKDKKKILYSFTPHKGCCDKYFIVSSFNNHNKMIEKRMFKFSKTCLFDDSICLETMVSYDWYEYNGTDWVNFYGDV